VCVCTAALFWGAWERGWEWARWNMRTWGRVLGAEESTGNARAICSTSRARSPVAAGLPTRSCALLGWNSQAGLFRLAGSLRRALGAPSAHPAALGGALGRRVIWFNRTECSIVAPASGPLLNV
jgi:hypothetical protein